MIYWNNKNYKGNFVKSGKRMFDPHMECPKCQKPMLYQIGNDKLKCGNCGNIFWKISPCNSKMQNKFEKRLNEGEEVKMKGWTFRKDDTGRISVIDPDGNLLDKDFKSVASFIDWFRYWKKDSLKSSRQIKSAVDGGWEVRSSDVPEALNLFVEYCGEETALEEIARAMDTDTLEDKIEWIAQQWGFGEELEDIEDVWDKYEYAKEVMGVSELFNNLTQAAGYDELAEDLAFIFRQYDFREWDKYDDEIESSRKVVKSSLDGLNPGIICDRMREKNQDSVEDHEENLDKINAFENAWETYQKSWEIFNNKYTLADIEEMYNGLEHLLEDEDKQVVEDWIEDIDEVFYTNKPLSEMSLNYGTTGNDIIESSRKAIKQSHVADINYYKQLVKSVLSNRMTEDEALNKIAVRNSCNKKYAESILNNWMDKYKEQLIKSDAEIADIMKEFDVDGDLNSWAEDYMPGSGKANTKGGELVRAAQRILTEYYDNGNMIGRGLGNETVNPAARYIVEKTNFDGNGEIEDMLNHLVQMDDNEYNSWCKRFEVDFADWLRSKGDLFEQPNEDDISDYAEDTDKEFFINKFYVEDSFGNQYWFDKEEDEFVCTEIQFAEDSTYSEDDVLKDGDEFTSEIDKTEDYGTFEKDGFIYDWEASGTQDEKGNYSEWKIVRVTISDQLFENDDTFDFDKVDDYNIFDINGNELKEADLLSL